MQHIKNCHGHPNVVKLIDILETEKEYFMVMEYLPLLERPVLDWQMPEKKSNESHLNDLCTYLWRRKNEGLKLPITEIEVKDLFRQMIDGIHFLSTQGIIVRDISLENFSVVELPDGRLILKYIDFGSARFLLRSSRCRMPDCLCVEYLNEVPSVSMAHPCAQVMCGHGWNVHAVSDNDSKMLLIPPQGFAGKQSTVRFVVVTCCKNPTTAT